ncbi:MAG: ROK family protein [Acidimicrobiales bacterium]
MAIAGVDVGGTNIGIGLVDDDHSVSHRAKEPTPTSVDELVGQVGRLVADLPSKVEAVGLALPAIVDHNEIVQMPNISGWNPDVDIAAELGDSLGIPVVFANDAQAGVVGEWVAGAAVGDSFVLGVWLGTGVGGGLVLDGRSYGGAGGGSGELGHMVVRPEGARCGCGRRGCLEAYAGRRMMTASAQALVDAGQSTRLFEIQAEKEKPKATSGVWAHAVDEGDAIAIALLDEAVGALGLAVASSLNLLDLDRVVIGGGMVDKFPDIASRIATAARPQVVRPVPDGLVVDATLGDDSGIVGAAHIASSSGANRTEGSPPS